MKTAWSTEQALFFIFNPLSTITPNASQVLGLNALTPKKEWLKGKRHHQGMNVSTTWRLEHGLVSKEKKVMSFSLFKGYYFLCSVESEAGKKK